MKIFNSIDEFKWQGLDGTAVAIGNFDGVHPGHLKIIQATVSEGLKASIPSGIFTFKVHPKNVISKAPVEYILSLPQRLRMFSELGVSFCILADVEKGFFENSPEMFVNDILVKKFKTKIISVGANFRFGHNAAANVNDLAAMQKKYNFKLVVEPIVKYENNTISSTRIREAIKNEDFDLANRLLNRKIFYTGIVIRGRQVGQTLGFPTANLDCSDIESINEGIYAVRIWLEQRRYYGVMYTGNLPTFGSNYKRTNEIHIFDFNDMKLYEKTLTVEPLEKLRNEMKFSSTEELKKQIERDIILAKKMIAEWRL